MALQRSRARSRPHEPMSYDSRLSANASHGNGRIGPTIPAVAQARFTIIAEDEVSRDEGAQGPESRTDPHEIE